MNNNHNNIFSLNKPFNGNPKDWFRFKREFNAVMNASGASKLIRSRNTLVSTNEYDKLDLNSKEDNQLLNQMKREIELYLYNNKHEPINNRKKNKNKLIKESQELSSID